MSVTTNEEKETKIELSEQGFRAILEAFTVEKHIDQLNVYYDSNWSLARRAVTCRVRFSRGEAPLACLKVPNSSSDSNTRSAKEIETRIGNGNAWHIRASAHRCVSADDDLPSAFCDELRALGVSRLERAGWVRNRRYVMSILDLGKFELDRLELPNGHVVFEAEIECTDDDVRDQIARRVRSIDPSATASKLSKFQRFWHAAADER